MAEKRKSPILLTLANMQSVQTLSIAGGEVAYFSTAGPERDRPNQDAAGIIPLSERAGVLVVADGVGSTERAEEASTLAVHCLKDTLEQIDPESSDSVRSAILTGLHSANTLITDLRTEAATTIMVCAIHAQKVTFFHAGDSTAACFGRNGKLKFQTVAHSPVGMLLASGELTEQQARSHNERHFISNALGLPELSLEESPTYSLQVADTVVLSTDGLTDNLYFQEIGAKIKNGSVRQSTEAIVTIARQRMLDHKLSHLSKPDDLTVLTFRRHRLKAAR